MGHVKGFNIIRYKNGIETKMLQGNKQTHEATRIVFNFNRKK